ncbi:winged helix-turn-helix transcriptional regulator [Rhodococcus qingshengii]
MREPREYEQNPPRHEYSVTCKGQSIWPVLTTM